MTNFAKDRELPRIDCDRQDIYDLVENLDPQSDLTDGETTEVVAAQIVCTAGVPRTVKVSKTYSDFADASTSKAVYLFTLPAGAIVLAAKFKHSASFTGGSISAYTISMGDPSTADRYVGASDVFQAPADGTIGQLRSDLKGVPQYHTHASAGRDMEATATSTGANLDQATAGAVDFWVTYLVAI